MQKIIIITAIMACAAASPAFLVEDHELHYPLVSKSTITHSNQIVDHGSTYIHAPIIPVIHEISSKKSTLTKSSQVVNHGGTAVLHAPVYHATEYHPVMYSHVVPSKTTVSKSNQVVNHGGTALIHAPVVHTPVIHTPVGYTPVVHTPVGYTPVVHTPVHYSYHASPVSVKTGDSATSHQSSTVHETEPVVNHVPLYAFHH